MHVEFATLPGSGADRVNEDWVGACASVAIVLDGVTAPGGMPTGCIHGVPWYVNQLGAHFLREATVNSGMTLSSCLASAISETADDHAETCDPMDPGTPSATVAALRLRDNEWEYLVLADATLVMETVSGLEVVTDQSVLNYASAQRQALYDCEPGTSRHTEMLHALVSEQRKFRNEPGGYWLAAAKPEAAAHAVVGTAPREALRRAAIMSDGAAAMVDTYASWTWSEYMDTLDRFGVGPALVALRAVEASDPHLTRWPRYKASDDATLLYLRTAAGSWDHRGELPP